MYARIVKEALLRFLLDGNSILSLTYDTGFKLVTVIGQNAESWMNSVVYYR